jgi:hypothetical protein
MKIVLIAACTKRKRAPVSPALTFESLPCSDAGALVSVWLERARDVVSTLQVDRLYAGGGWASTLQVREAAAPFGTCALYVCSAGFGLVSSDELLPAYSASFAPGESQVARRIAAKGSYAERHQLWWRTVNQARHGEAFPLTALAAPESKYLVIVGADYLDAIRLDLAALAGRCGPEQLCIISVGIPAAQLDKTLRSCLLPIDVRAELLLPGPRSSINPRAAAWFVRDVLKATGWNRECIDAHIAETLAGAAVQHRRSAPARQKLDDTEVMAWIRDELQRREAAPGVLLRALRQSNLACEEGRFRRLLEAVRQEAPKLAL